MSDDINRQIFREEAYELLVELETTLLELEGRPDDMDIVNRVFRALHTIKGSGSMFGFDDIAEFTHEVESMFDMVRNGQLQVTRPLLNQVFAVRDHIQRMLDEGGGDEVDSAEAKDILEKLRCISSGEAEPEACVTAVVAEEPVAEEPVADAPADADVPVDADAAGVDGAQDAAAELEAASDSSAGEKSEEPAAGTEQPLRRMLVRISPLSPDTGEDFHIEPLLEELAKLGHCEVRADDAAVPPLESYVPGHIYVSWEVLLETAHDEEAVKDVFFFSDAPLEIEVVEASEPLNAAPEDEGWELLDSTPSKASLPDGPAASVSEVQEPTAAPKSAAEPKPKPAPAAEPKPAPVAKPAPKPAPAAEPQPKPAVQADAARQQDAVTSIRVAAEKLDSLVDLVGELVIVQAQITQLAQERDDSGFKRLAEDLERLSDELRDTALGVRMLPIGTSFSKFRRLVRDLSGELGKEIELATTGADTELDKTVIERLADPLVHLLRNSIDHGVELPDEREAAGKPRRATIRLSAEHSGGEVLIRILDDGKGIDPDVIRAKALERGLISPESDLSRADILNLIFEPGFSTAKQVTSVSGRGVGMDVVKRAIDSLRGRIEIASTKGEGTEITIRLPLTLAIIDGLQVRVGEEFYVVPLAVVEECVELRAEDEAGSDRRILYLRGEIVPYIQLREWFEINAPRPEIEQVVIVGLEGRRVGIVVDKVIGEHQTVIKSLGKIYKDVDGISGATIKGDGSIALILDVPGLMKRVVAESA
ncbi:chemotaxis protein CheA [Paucidesulfovibrio longus]|uniref:chemotaxis protein CheA n=1 Tax=Paucidesulfovibrio longus TaxID=889 RepID=UPI0003B6BE87|nr:chemotaxis protein CheA [Paucidesulfovibrio longus]